jgi:O-antigen biosynthesis protein
VNVSESTDGHPWTLPATGQIAKLADPHADHRENPLTKPSPGHTTPLASVVVPVFNALGRVESLLDCLSRQACDFAWDVTFVDSGSDDGTQAWLAERALESPFPLHVVELGSEAFDHGDTRNFGAARTTGELLVFLTDDARPIGTDWLALVALELTDKGADAVYCLNLVPAGTPAWATTLALSDSLYKPNADLPRTELDTSEPGPTELRDRALYCDTASAIHRSVLERHPYPRADAGEDMLLARALVEAGLVVRKLDHVPVEHIHLYTPAGLRKRAHP